MTLEEAYAALEDSPLRRHALVQMKLDVASTQPHPASKPPPSVAPHGATADPTPESAHPAAPSQEGRDPVMGRHPRDCQCWDCLEADANDLDHHFDYMGSVI